MADTFPNDTLWQVTVHGQQALGSHYENVYHFWQYTWAGPGPEQGSIETALYTYLVAIFNAGKDMFPSTAKWDYATTKYKLPSGTDWVEGPVVQLGLTGNDASNPLPAGVSAQITGKTALKKKRARKFFPPFAERMSDQNVWLGQAVTQLAVMAVKWVTGIDLSPVTTWLYPIIMNTVTGGDPWDWTKITAGVANAIPAYQRRRKPGVGV